MGFAERPQLPAHPMPCSKGVLCCTTPFSMDTCTSDFSSFSPSFLQGCSKGEHRASCCCSGHAASQHWKEAELHRLGPAVVLHSEVALLGTAWQLFSPLGKETLSSCLLLTFGDANLEKQALGRLLHLCRNMSLKAEI